MPLALTLTLTAPEAAHAAFPAKNGPIAFAADTGNGYRIYTVEPNGHRLRQVTPDRFDASTPDWSPDGRLIAFSKNECHIALIHPDGTGLRTIPSRTPGGCEGDPVLTSSPRSTTPRRTTTPTGSWTSMAGIVAGSADQRPPRSRQTVEP
jgi:dipeptidyl aminopeptidase/acylaminoacyl peptidase